MSRSFPMQRKRAVPGAQAIAQPVLQRKCACGNHIPGGGTCAACAAKDDAHDGRDEAAPVASTTLFQQHQPLEPRTRQFMERRFGQDFSNVRVHSGGGAAESARAVNAHAYTMGEHIVFGQGRYAPSTQQGNQLLAHELTHVVQQRQASPQPQYRKAVSQPGDAAEREADSVADRVMRSRRGDGPVPVSQAPSADMQQMSTGAAIGVTLGAVAGAALIGAGIAALVNRFGKRNRGSHPDCPTSHTIPDDVATAIDAAWAQSAHGTASPVEHGGRMVTDSGGASQIRTGSGDSGTVDLPAEQAGDTTTGTFHTHPYANTPQENSELGVSFSGDDIENFIDGGQGNVKYIGAGSCMFALTIQDTAARDTCRNEDIRQRYRDAISGASGSFQERVEASVNAAIRGCGLCHYKTCRPDEASPIPRTAQLA